MVYVYLSALVQFVFGFRRFINFSCIVLYCTFVQYQIDEPFHRTYLSARNTRPCLCKDNTLGHERSTTGTGTGTDNLPDIKKVGVESVGELLISIRSF